VPEPLIAITDITRTYNVGDFDVQALRGVSLRVDPGEFVAIVGAS
jgi:macrolide transport system ATP-binding/permease protein